MILLIQSGEMDDSKLLSVIRQTFNKRNTHQVPTELPTFLDEWSERFATLARECRLKMSMTEALLLVKNYYRSLISEQP